MDSTDIFRNIMDLLFPEQRPERRRGYGAQHLQRPPQCQPRMAVVLGAFIAAPIGAVILQKTVQAVRRLLHGAPALRLGGGQQKGGQQQVLGTPAGPVAHGFCSVSHPPEVLAAPGQQHPVLHLPVQPLADARGGRFQLCPQQVMHQRQQTAGLGGKQVHHRAGGVRQRQLRGIPDIAVVGGQLPGALFTDGPQRIQHRFQTASAVLDTLCQHQSAQPGPAGKIGILPAGAPSGACKIQPGRQRQGSNGLRKGIFPRFAPALLCRGRQCLPKLPLGSRRAGTVIRQIIRQVG